MSPGESNTAYLSFGDFGGMGVGIRGGGTGIGVVLLAVLPIDGRLFRPSVVVTTFPPRSGGLAYTVISAVAAICKLRIV